MINLFRKKKEPVTVYVGDNAPLGITEKEFNRVVDGFRERIDKLEEKNARLERIMKYAPVKQDELGYYLYEYKEEDVIFVDTYFSCRPTQRRKYKKRLYIYRNREEYAVELEELTDNLIVIGCDNIKWINKKDSLVEIAVMTHDELFQIPTLRNDHIIKKHTFTIDFKSGKYLYKCEDVEVNIMDDAKEES